MNTIFFQLSGIKDKNCTTFNDTEFAYDSGFKAKIDDNSSCIHIPVEIFNNSQCQLY